MTGNGWPMVPLSEVLSLVCDRVPVDPTASYPFAGVYGFGRGLMMREPISGNNTTYKWFHRLHEDDIVISTPKAWEGAVARVPKAFAGRFVSPVYPTFRARQSVLPAYLEWYFKRQAFWAELRFVARGIGARRESVSPQAFLSLAVPLPPIEEQRRIVAWIESMAGKIHEAISVSHGVADQINALTARASIDALAGCHTEQRLRELTTIITDGTHLTPTYVEDGHMFLSAQNVKPFHFMPETHRKVSYEDYRQCVTRAKPARGDVMMARVGAGIGEAAVVDRDLDCAFYVSLALIRPISEKIDPHYLVHWLNSPHGRAMSRAQTLGKGHSQGNLNLKLLREFPVPVPAIDKQKKIVTHLDAIYRKAEAVRSRQEQSAAELDALMPSILGKAFKGELIST